MTVELRPTGVACNIQCQYCYQNPIRDADNIPRSYDLEAMKAAVEREGGPFTVFGGEPLLVPDEDLEALWAWGLDRFGTNGIQTNGVLIDDNHVRMFHQYQVRVGISIDGPGELNDVRWAGTLERTRGDTVKTEAAIGRLCREGIPPSVIVTLHRGNATAEKLPVLHDWFRQLEAMGVTSARLHDLEVEGDDIGAAYALSHEENMAAFLSFAALETELSTLRFDVFDDMRNLLLGNDDQSTCVWNACDPYTTRAVRGVEGNGQSSNCGRTNKDGIDFVKAPVEGFERYLALYHTPQEYGGCSGCRFFIMCKGQCPGTAIDGDWRNRTRDCELWKGMFSHLEDGMLDAGMQPLSASRERTGIEGALLDLWSAGRSLTIAGARRWMNEGRDMAAVSAGGGSPADSPHGSGGRPVEKAVPRGRPHEMERLDCTLPDFTRLAWVTDGAARVWRPQLERIATAWAEIEWRAVLHGVRACAVSMASPEEFPTLGATWAEEGLDALPVEMQGGSAQPYSPTGVAAEAGQPFVFRFVVGRQGDVAAFKAAWDAGEQDAIGDLLGYPACCREFFRRACVDDAMVDTTWPMAAATADAAPGATTIEASGPPESNILWRWMGVRAVPHLPCRLDCAPTAELGRRLIEVGRKVGFAQEMDWLTEVLSWSVEWSALHGIAQVKTPVLKVSTRSDATARRYVVRRQGSAHPAEGARGLTFPFAVPVKLRVSGSRGFRRGLENAVRLHPRPGWYAADDGFSSVGASGKDLRAT